VTPSLIGCQRNAPSSRRFQYKSGQARPRPRSSPAPRGCRRRVGSRQASSPPERGRPPQPKSCRCLHRPQHLRQRRNIGSGTDAHHRRPSAISIVPHGIAQEAATDGAGASTITCAKVTPPAAVEAPRRRTVRRCTLRRQPNICCGVSPCRRATAEPLSPLS